MNTKNTGIIYSLEDRPPFLKALLGGIQHVLASFVGVLIEHVSQLAEPRIELPKIKEISRKKYYSNKIKFCNWVILG